MARPFGYNPDIAAELCAELATGVSVRTLLEGKDRKKGYPCRKTFFLWLNKFPEFKEMYMAAKAESADAMLEDMFDIADNEPDVKRARLQVDVRKWAASKLKPERYGDKVTQELTGKDGGPIEFNEIRLVGVKPDAS